MAKTVDVQSKRLCTCMQLITAFTELLVPLKFSFKFLFELF